MRYYHKNEVENRLELEWRFVSIGISQYVIKLSKIISLHFKFNTKEFYINNIELFSVSLRIQ